MKKLYHLITFFIFGLPGLSIYGQCITCMYHNYYIVDSSTTSKDALKATKNSLQIIFYTDSVPPAKWMEPKYSKVGYMSIDDPNEHIVTYVANQWAQNIDLKK